MAKHSYLISEGALNAAQLELLTLRDLLRWGFTQFNRADLFYGHGTDNAWDEIIYLTLASLKLGPTLNPAFLAARLTLTERSLLLDRIRQRVNERIPSAYLVKQAYFAGLSFFVDRRVLIPRSPMAELIEQQFSPWISQADHINTILDLGTGSGCIAIACAYAFPEARIDAVDNSKEALAVAAINVATHQLQGQVNLIQSDLFENLSSRLYDIIISNPPYVDEEDLANLPAEYRHEPMAALAAGRDGLDFIIRLLKQALKYLKNNGILMVEVGNSKEALIQRYPQIPFIWLEFERGDAEIFLLTQEQLSCYEQEI